MKITEHFDSTEFDQPAKHGQPSIAYPPEWIYERLFPLCAELEKIREKLGNHPITIISGFRSPQYNSHIGGAKKSQHMEGKAADIVVNNIEAEVVYQSILQMQKAKVISIGGLGKYPTFTHVDIRNTNKLSVWSGGRTDS